MCFAVALWNGKDPFLKERLYGLTGNEGNHAEDVKECYFYLDSTPTHSWMRYLYKYPQAAFPYEELLHENRRRGRGDPEFELMDTGIFDENRYFDLLVEYAKAGPEDILIVITASNRGPEAADLHVLPTFWFRNTWSWNAAYPTRGQVIWRSRPNSPPGTEAIDLECRPVRPPARTLYFEALSRTARSRRTRPTIARCSIGLENSGARSLRQRRHQRLSRQWRDQAAVNPEQTGTKAAAHCFALHPAGTRRVLDACAPAPLAPAEARFAESRRHRSRL